MNIKYRFQFSHKYRKNWLVSAYDGAICYTKWQMRKCSLSSLSPNINLYPTIFLACQKGTEILYNKCFFLQTETWPCDDRFSPTIKWGKMHDFKEMRCFRHGGGVLKASTFEWVPDTCLNQLNLKKKEIIQNKVFLSLGQKRTSHDVAKMTKWGWILIQGHFLSTHCFPPSSYSCLEIHICWKVPWKEKKNIL